MIKTLPLGAPSQTSSLVGVADGSQGRMRMEGMKLALFDSSSCREAWNMLSGTRGLPMLGTRVNAVGGDAPLALGS